MFAIVLSLSVVLTVFSVSVAFGSFRPSLINGKQTKAKTLCRWRTYGNCNSSCTRRHESDRVAYL